MGGRTVLATLAGKGPSQRLQVSLSQGDDGRLLIDLREQHYADGIGWFDQRRLELDPRQFQQLQSVLALKSDAARSGHSGTAGDCAVSGPGAESAVPTRRRQRSQLGCAAGRRLYARTARRTKLSQRSAARQRLPASPPQPTFCRPVLPCPPMASSRFLSSFSRWSTPSCSSVQMSSRTTRRATSFSPQSSIASV